MFAGEEEGNREEVKEAAEAPLRSFVDRSCETETIYLRFTSRPVARRPFLAGFANGAL